MAEQQDLSPLLSTNQPLENHSQPVCENVLEAFHQKIQCQVLQHLPDIFHTLELFLDLFFLKQTINIYFPLQHLD